MESSYSLVILFSLIGGLFSLSGGIILLSRQKFAKKFAYYATPFAAGALLSAVFIDLLPEGIESSKPQSVLNAALVGMVTFFFMQKFLHWFHHHGHQKSDLTDPKVGLIVFGDTLHNALDGVAIASAFLINVPTGIITTIVVAAHEIPQEIGDMGLLLARGLSRKKVLLVNIMSAMFTTLSAVTIYSLGEQNNLPVGVLFGLSAGFLLYISASDIIPELLNGHDSPKKGFDWQSFMLVFGILIVGLSVDLSHKYMNQDSSVNQIMNQPTCFDAVDGNGFKTQICQ